MGLFLTFTERREEEQTRKRAKDLQQEPQRGVCARLGFNWLCARGKGRDDDDDDTDAGTGDSPSEVIDVTSSRGTDEKVNEAAKSEEGPTVATEVPKRAAGLKRELEEVDERRSRQLDLATETYQRLREAEARDRPAPSDLSPTPLMRAVLLDWLTDVHSKLRLGSPALHLGFLLLDRYLAVAEVDRAFLQLMAMACLIVAAKHEDMNPPSLSECTRFLEGPQRRRQDIAAAEKRVLEALGFRLLRPTAMDFLDRYLALPGGGPLSMPRARYFAERALYEPSVCWAVAPSRLAAASVYLARRNTDDEAWPAMYQSVSGYTEDQLLSLASVLSRLIHEPLPTVGPRPLTALTRKYAAPRFREVARLQHAQI